MRRSSECSEAAAPLDLVAEVLETLGIGNDDGRFHFNPRSDAQWVLPLTVGHRYVACKALEVEAGEWLRTWAFARKRYDPVEGAPLLVQYRADFVRRAWPTLRPLVFEVAARELENCRGMTPLRHKHNSQAYALALDDATRAEALTGLALTGSDRSRRKSGT